MFSDRKMLVREKKILNMGMMKLMKIVVLIDMMKRRRLYEYGDDVVEEYLVVLI